MAFRNIYTGEACNSDGQRQMSQNPFKQFMDKMLFGQTQQLQDIKNIRQIQQQVNVQQDQRVTQQILERQQMFEQMNKQWDAMAKQYDQSTLEQRKMMEAMYLEEQRKYEQMMIQQQMIMDMQWQQSEMYYQANQIAQEYMFQEAYENAEEMQQQSQNAQNYAGDIIEVMAKDPDPRFQQSKFLSFLKDIQQGKLKLEGNQLLTNDGQKVEQPALERIVNLKQNWDQSVQKQEQKQSDLTEVEEKFQKMWDDRVNDYEKELQNEDQFSKKLEETYQNILKEMDTGQDFDKMFSLAWQAASDLM